MIIYFIFCELCIYLFFTHYIGKIFIRIRHDHTRELRSIMSSIIKCTAYENIATLVKYCDINSGKFDLIARIVQNFKLQRATSTAACTNKVSKMKIKR